MALVETDEMAGIFEPVAAPKGRFLSNGKRSERVRLSLDTSWWDGKGRVVFVGGDGTQLIFSGVDSIGAKQSIPLKLGYQTWIRGVGDFDRDRDRDRILAPSRLVRPSSLPSDLRSSEEWDGKTLQVERGVPVEHLSEIGLTKGSVRGRLSAAQFVIEKIGEVSLATSSKLVRGSVAYRFSEAKVVTVVRFEDDDETRTDVVRVDGVAFDLRSWQVIEGKLVRTSLMPAFQGADGHHWSPVIGELILVHPDGMHALAVNPEIMGALSAFGWTRSGFRFDVPLSGIKGIDGSDDFPPISEGEVAKMRLILTGVTVRKRIKVTIPPTPWQLSY